MIPNREVLGIYEKRIPSWFKVRIVSDTVRWQQGDYKEVQRLFNEFMSMSMSMSISIRDTYVRKEIKENFYHGMLLGLCRRRAVGA